jgi:hypothetical protein
MYPLLYINTINVSTVAVNTDKDFLINIWNISKVLRLLRVMRFFNNNFKAADSEFSKVSK